MNQHAILQSNLLDIIFENRNKDYGAYKLRKSYQGRLSIAVLSTVGFAGMLSLFMFSQNSFPVVNPVVHSLVIPDTKIAKFRQLDRPANKKTLQGATIKGPEIEKPPAIVADNINNLPATPVEILPSFTGAVDGEMNLPGAGVADDGGSDGNTATVNGDLPTPGKPDPVEIAEIMPQYPGGIRALLAFLKKNIHSPGNVEEGEDVLVKIKFVVNYDGNLENFIVLKSGGEIFDNEVLRVLKRMPGWIPGKSDGKNVSVFFTVPVRFTSEF